MKIPLSWLKEYIDIELSPTDLGHRLTMAGTEGGDIEGIGGSWGEVYVGRVLKVYPHPNADRLRLTTVDLGSEEITVVCGAPNLAADQMIAFARVGARLIDSRTGEIETLETAKIRGIESSGMVCSERELGLGDDHTGILVLPEDAPLGTSLSDYMGDVVLDLDVTPNRPDCLSVLGVAREIAALTGKRVREPDADYFETGDDISGLISVEIADADLCRRYTATILQGIKVGPSPDWLQARLIKAGQRPINNVVDVTNYVMLEYGQPLHAFDYDNLTGGKIIVRPARDGERFVTLDGTEHVMRYPMLVIADANDPVGLAGIIGGLNSEIKESTTTVLLESANFDSINTRRTARALRIRSEASSRFDKGLQPDLAPLALKRATRLIQQLAGGRVCQGFIDAYPIRVKRPHVVLTYDRLRQVLGIDIEPARVKLILDSLGFEMSETSDNRQITVSIPYWRSDITQADDLVEEIARIIGYDELPTSMLSGSVPHHEPQPSRELREHAKDLMVQCGMQEIISYSLTSFISLDTALAWDDELKPLRVANPMSTEQEYLRTTLRGSILSTLSINQHNSRDGLKLFEAGRVYIPREQDLPEEREVLVGVMAGRRTSENWLIPDEYIDFYDAKGVVETLLDQLGVEYIFDQYSDPLFMPGRCAEIRSGQLRIGVMGEVHTQVLERFQIDTAPVILFDLDLEYISQILPDADAKFQSLPRYPGAYRDLALVLARDIQSSKVQAVIQKHSLVACATLFDVYEGTGIPEGKCSLAYRVLFQVSDRTLSGQEVNEAQSQILASLEKELGASIRT